MSGDKRFTKFPDLPAVHWTIIQQERGPFHPTQWFGLNTKTGAKTKLYDTYGLALKEVERLEWYP